MASALGVGLIEMTGTMPRLRITEVVGAPIGSPIERLRLELAEKLGYSTCTVCRSTFERGDRQSFRRKVTTSVAKAIETDKGLIYWLDKVAARQPPPSRASRTSWTSTDRVYNRGYVCPDCLRALLSD